MTNYPQTNGRRGRGTTLFGFSSLLITALLALPLYFAANTGQATPLLRDPDIWWHMRNAEQLLTTHQFIRTDTYSFSVYGQPWINPEWLAEMPYYLGFRIAGERGILFVMLGAMEATLIGVVTLCYLRCRNFMSAYIATWVFMLLGSINFGPRTLLFGWICLAIEMILLELFSRRSNLLWGLPILFAFWVNFHGSWIIGLAFLLLYIVSGLGNGSWGSIYAERWSPEQLRKLIKVSVASLAALFVNPYGWKLVIYPFDLAFRQKLNVSVGEEWRSLNFHAGNGKTVFVLICTLLVVTLWKGLRWPLYQVLFALLSIYSGFTYFRFLFLIGITLCPQIGVTLSKVIPTDEQPKPTRPVLNAVLIALIWSISFYRLPVAEVLHHSVEKAFPTPAFAELRMVDPRAHVFNAYGYGGYMVWAARDIPTFVDSRTDIFEHHGIFADYLKAINLQDTLGILNKYNIKYVFFPKPDPVVYLLEHNPGWKVEYDDGNAVILQRIASSSQKPLPTESPRNRGVE